MKHEYLKDVATLRLSADKCVGCGRCAEVCPHEVFIVEDGKAALLDKNACIECGACAKNCPAEAISVETGVGCADAFIRGWIKGSKPGCDCDSSEWC